MPNPNELASIQEIYTTGYPRSGNTWLGRLLSDLYDSPLQTMPGEEVAYFGPEQDGKYVIRKKHIPSEEKPSSGKVVFIQRDPRDVMVSAMFYRSKEPTSDNLMQVIRSACTPDGDPQYKIYHDMGAYEHFVRSWTDTGLADVTTKYESLKRTHYPELRRIGRLLTGQEPTLKQVDESYTRQLFDNWKEQYPHSMRKGIVGDWRAHFKREHGRFITQHLGALMFEQRYISDLYWWKDLPK